MAEPLTQRRLSLELRYDIDTARQAQRRAWSWLATRNRLIQTIAKNPKGMASQHVLHNLGKERLDWLRKEGIFDGNGQPQVRSRPPKP